MENIVDELTLIHNENFENKVENKYFSEMILNGQYEIYCLFNFGEENNKIIKLKKESDVDNEKVINLRKNNNTEKKILICCILWYNREHGYFRDSNKKRISGAKFW